MFNGFNIDYTGIADKKTQNAILQIISQASSISDELSALKSQITTLNNENIKNKNEISNLYYLLNNKKVYIAGRTYNGVALNVTATNGTLVRAVFIPYQVSDGSWEIEIKLSMTFSPATAGATINIPGIIFKNISNHYQPLACLGYGSVYAYSFVNPNTSTFVVQGNTTNSVLTVEGKAELESKPTWVV